MLWNDLQNLLYSVKNNQTEINGTAGDQQVRTDLRIMYVYRDKQFSKTTYLWFLEFGITASQFVKDVPTQIFKSSLWQSC